MADLDVQGLSVYYESNTAICNANLSVDGSCLCALFGPNGSGKSTLIKAICNLIDFSGSVTVHEKSVKSTDPRELARLLSYVPQNQSFSYGYRVIDVVMMGDESYLSFASDRKMQRAAEECLDEMDILQMRNRKITELSGGERQLVQIARALNQRTPMLLFDEPAAYLDFGNQRILWEKLLRMKEKKTIIVSSHDPNHIAWFCDFVVVIDKGKVSEKKPASSLGLDDICKLYPGEWADCDQNGFRCITPKFPKTAHGNQDHPATSDFNDNASL